MPGWGCPDAVSIRVEWHYHAVLHGKSWLWHAVHARRRVVHLGGLAKWLALLLSEDCLLML